MFVGDDLTDEYGFAAVDEPQADGRSRSGAGRRSAHYRLRDVAAVRALARRAGSTAQATPGGLPMPRNLDLALIGNGAIGLLVDSTGRRRVGLLSALRRRRDVLRAARRRAAAATERGIYAVEIIDHDARRAVVSSRTRRSSSRDCSTGAGGAIEITDCVPRFMQHGRVFHPMAHVRVVRRLAGSPRIRVRLRPAARLRARASRRHRSAAATSATSCRA